MKLSSDFVLNAIKLFEFNMSKQSISVAWRMQENAERIEEVLLAEQQAASAERKAHNAQEELQTARANVFSILLTKQIYFY